MQLVKKALLGDTNDALESKFASDLNLEEPFPVSILEPLLLCLNPPFDLCGWGPDPTLFLCRVAFLSITLSCYSWS